MPGRKRSLDVNFFCTPAVYLIPWVPETFHARFPVSVKSSRGFAARVFGLRPKTCWPAADIRRKLLLSGTQGIYLKAIFTIFRKAFAPPWKPYRIGHLFTHKNCVLAAVSVTAQSCAATISKVLCHSIYWRGFVPYFAAAWTSITTVAEVDKQERELESSAPNLLGQTRRRDVWCERTCAVSDSFPCGHESLSDTVWT